MFFRFLLCFLLWASIRIGIRIGIGIGIAIWIAIPLTSLARIWLIPQVPRSCCFDGQLGFATLKL